MKKWLGLGLLALLLGLALWVQDAMSWADWAVHYSEVKAAVSARRVEALALFCILYAVAVALSLPIALWLTLAGAALFGWWGLLPIWLGATLGAAVVFLVVRYFLAQWAAERLAGPVERVRSAFLANPVRWALTLRFFPVMPFWMANAIPAVLGMSFRSYVLCTAVGILPGTLVYVGVGVGLDQVLSQGQTPDLAGLSEPDVWLPLLALALLTGGSALWSRMRTKDVS